MELVLKHYTDEYEGFKYRVDDGRFTVLLDGEPIISFADEVSLKRFIDRANEVTDRFVMPPIRLHLTGCSRCRKTAAGTKFDPCKTGIPIFQATKINAMALVKAHAAAIKEAQGAAANVSPP